MSRGHHNQEPSLPGTTTLRQHDLQLAGTMKQAASVPRPTKQLVIKRVRTQGEGQWIIQVPDGGTVAELKAALAAIGGPPARSSSLVYSMWRGGVPATDVINERVCLTCACACLSVCVCACVWRGCARQTASCFRTLGQRKPSHTAVRSWYSRRRDRQYRHAVAVSLVQANA